MQQANRQQANAPLCPSAQPTMSNCQVLGVLTEGEDGRRLSYLNQRLEVTDAVLAMAGPAKPTQVFRFAGTCEENKCAHFDGQDCHLAKRIVQIMPAVVHRLPPCIVRANCRWYVQEGKNACLRCPQVSTWNSYPTEQLKKVAGPQPGPCTPPGAFATAIPRAAPLKSPNHDPPASYTSENDSDST